MDPECEVMVLFISTTKWSIKVTSIDRRTPPNTTTAYESTTVRKQRLHGFGGCVDWSVKLQASTRIVMPARIRDSCLYDSSRHPSSNSQLGIYSTHCITQLLRSWSADRSVSARLSG